MEFTESVLDSIQEEPSLEYSDDIDMMDVEEGEVVDRQILEKVGEGNEGEVMTEPGKEDSHLTGNMNKNKKRKKSKKKSKKKKGAPGSCGLDIDRFVLDVCRRLRERKTYLVYTAVGVLGLSALSDLVKEVDAIQACGGQKTADGNRFRKGGGILWNIMKVRDPNAYKEIMKKGKEFEVETSVKDIVVDSYGSKKQFKQPMIAQRPMQCDTEPQVAVPFETSDVISEIKTSEELPKEPTPKEQRKSVHDRIRVPVSYDDLLGEELPKEQSALD